MIVTVVRPYGGLEGKRIRIGTQFWVAKPGTKGTAPEGVTTIAFERYRELKARNMLVDGKPDGLPTRIKVANTRKAPAAASQKGKAPKPLNDREKAEKRHKGQNGGRTGRTAAPSSSQAAPAQEPSTGLLGQRKRRGQRASVGSPSTTGSNSAPGQTANTEQTGDGGGTTQNPSENGEKGTKPPFV